MANYNTTAGVTITINGRQAQQMLQQLQQQARDAERNLQRAAAAGDRISMQRYQRELTQTRRAINQLQGQAATAADVLTRLDRATPKELRKALRELERQLEGIERGSDAWNAHVERIRQVRNELNNVNREIRAQSSGQQSFLNRLGGVMTGSLQGMMSGVMTLSGAISIADKSIRDYASIQEEMAGVSKYSGLAAEDIERLNEAFKSIDTRTSRAELNRLAQDAGRLGKNDVDSILGFVRAADQINVALDDLGDGATLTLSKLTDIFGIEAEMGTEKALLSAGSVINELSQSCSASAPYIAEFAARMGGVGSAAGMTIDQIMAFGALLDSQGINVEASSTALQQLINRMMTDPAKYAQAAGLEVEKFSKLIKEDMNGALLLFFETLNKSGDMSTLAPMFADMGENGANAVKTLATLAGQIDTLKVRQQEASEAFAEGVSITNEAAVANGTVAAELDKARNRTAELSAQLGEKLWPLMTALNKGAAAGLSILSSMIDFVSRNNRAIIAAVAAYGLLKAAVYRAEIREKALMAVEAAHNLALKAKSVLLATVTAAHHLGAAAIHLFSGNTVLATRSLQAFNTVCRANPIGLVVSVIAAAITALISFRSETEATNEVAKESARIVENATARREEERQEIERNIKKLQTFNGTKSEEQRLVDELNRKYGPVLGQYQTLAQWLDTLKRRGAEYCTVVYEQITAEGKLEAARQLIAEAARKRVDAQAEDPGWWETFKAFTAEGSWSAAKDRARRKQLNKADLEAVKLENAAKQLEKEATEIQTRLGEKLAATTVTPDVTPSTPGGSGKPDKSNRPDQSDRPDQSAEAAARAALSRQISELDRLQKAAEAQLELDYYRRDSEIYHNEEKKQIRLHQIRLEYLEKKRDLYEKDSEEEKRLTASIDEENRKERLRVTKAWEKDLAAWSREYQMQERRRQYDLELELLDTLHEAQRISEEEYLQALRELRRKYADDTIEGSSGKPSPESTGGKEAARDSYTRKKADLEAWFALNPDQEEEYRRRLKEIEKEYFKSGMEQARAMGSEYTDMLLDVWDAFSAFFDDTEEQGGNWASKLGGCMQAVFALMTAGMQAYSQYSEACQELEIARIEKRYDREIELAEGNSYRVKKAEEEKERKVAAIKAEASKKQFEMQIIQAVAQTATNALMAYGSALAVPVVGYILAPIAAAMAIAAGAVQIATIRKQKQAADATGYSEGGFTRPGAIDEPAGIVHAGEWVASQKLVNNPRTRPIIDMLEQAQRTNTIAALTPADVSASITAPLVTARRQTQATAPAAPQLTQAKNSGMETMTELRGTLDRLTGRLSRPFVTVATVSGDKGINQAQEDYQRLLRNKQPKTFKQ